MGGAVGPAGVPLVPGWCRFSVLRHYDGGQIPRPRQCRISSSKWRGEPFLCHQTIRAMDTSIYAARNFCRKPVVRVPFALSG